MNPKDLNYNHWLLMQQPDPGTPIPPGEPEQEEEKEERAEVDTRML